MAARWILPALIPVVLLCGCVGETLNIGSKTAGEETRPYVTDARITAESWNAGETATVTVTWSGIWAPFEYTIDTGCSAGILTGTMEHVEPIVVTFTLEEGYSFEGKAHVTNHRGNVNLEDRVYGGAFSYGPVGPALN